MGGGSGGDPSSVLLDASVPGHACVQRQIELHMS
jgi:hypothetical protein